MLNSIKHCICVCKYINQSLIAWFCWVCFWFFLLNNRCCDFPILFLVKRQATLFWKTAFSMNGLALPSSCCSRRLLWVSGLCCSSTSCCGLSAAHWSGLFFLRDKFFTCLIHYLAALFQGSFRESLKEYLNVFCNAFLF